MSGTPAVELASPAPLIYTASKPARSTWRAMAAFGTPGIITVPLAINSRSLPGLVRCIRSLLLLLLPLPLGWHLHRPHQFADILCFIEFPHKIDNPMRSLFPKCRRYEREELSFNLRVMQRIFCVTERINIALNSALRSTCTFLKNFQTFGSAKRSGSNCLFVTSPSINAIAVM